MSKEPKIVHYLTPQEREDRKKLEKMRRDSEDGVARIAPEEAAKEADERNKRYGITVPGRTIYVNPEVDVKEAKRLYDFPNNLNLGGKKPGGEGK